MIKLLACTTILLMLYTLSTCRSNKPVDCRDIKVKRVYVNMMRDINSTSYAHYLLLTNYEDECFATVNFSALARKYVDTCTYRRPVEIIRFLYSTEGIDFVSNEPDLAETKKYELMSFMMDSTSVRKIYFIRDGVRKTIELKDCDFKETYYE